MDSAVRTILRALFSSPDFLYLTAPPGPLDDNALAARLALFLWKSMPDEQLMGLAGQGKLTDPSQLRLQVDRMLNDSKSKRMVVDFANQWLRLSDIEATTPDKQLYPEYDSLLKMAMLEETYSYLQYMIENDSPCQDLIASDYTFLNRRLAEHYQMDEVRGLEMQRVKLPAGSVRGGLMTQASVLKVTANGTTTSPVRRGSWVLTALMGTPPNPPPAGAGSVEPDTRGTSTIRELLEKHRSDASCNNCHRSIDPPGFALESFDVIGGFQERYRLVAHGDLVGQGDLVPPTRKFLGRNVWEYRLGKPVDPSGQTADGKRFRDIQQFKQQLLQEREKVAENVIRQLLIYSTGEEIQFADRQVVKAILESSRASNYGLRTIIHQVVASRLFREN
jgi:hypothetical protein